MSNDKNREKPGASGSAEHPAEPAVTRGWLDADFLLGLEQDLLAPLSVIINNMEVHSESTSDAQRSSLCSSTQLAAERLRQTVLRLIDLARLDTDPACSHDEPVSLSSVLTEAVLSLRHAFPESEHDVTFDSNAADAVIVADRERLFRMFVSLLAVVSGELPVDARIRIRSRYKTTTPGLASVSVSLAFDSSATQSSLWYQSFESSVSMSPSSARSLLYSLYAQKVAEHLGGTVVADQRRARVTFEGEFPVVRIGPGRERASRVTETDMSVAVLCDSHPLEADFYERLASIDIEYRPFSTASSLSESMTESWPSAVILRHTQAGSKVASSAQTIRALEQGRRVPILLVSKSIDYETLRVCRRYVNAVLMDPFSSEQLLRYVIGMSRPDRRRSKRALELHA